jgi:glycosyltransferase involved in cell wall biosynthesis
VDAGGEPPHRGVTTAGLPPRSTAPSVLVLVENESVPADARVWAECRTLARAGFHVVVLSPQGKEWDRGSFEQREGIEIHRFPLRYAGGGLGYAIEYASALTWMWRLARRLARTRSFAVVHAANPPDFLLLAALPARRRGAHLIFDQHDLVPELCLSRFGRAGRVLFPVARALELLAYSLADVVIAVNESHRAVAMRRGGRPAEDVFVVRNGPDLSLFSPQPPDPSLKRGKPHLVAYVGNMEPQDGVEHGIRALALLRRRRRDWHAVFVGGGSELRALQALARDLGVGDAIEFTGFLDRPSVVRTLASCDVCIAPEPQTPYNDASTMIKIAEYMAMSRPIVAFDLTESRFSADRAAVYVSPTDDERFAAAIDALLDDSGRREAMGRMGRERVEAQLAWHHSERELLRAYERVLNGVPGERRWLRGVRRRRLRPAGVGSG